MLDKKPLKQREIRLRKRNIPSKQRMDRIRSQSESRNALIQLANRDSSVVTDFSDLLDKVAVAARDPADAEARERVGFAERAGGDGVCVAGGEERRREVVIEGRDGVEEGPVDFVTEDGNGFGFGVVCQGVNERFGEDGTCRVLRVAGGKLLDMWVQWEVWWVRA